MVAGVQQKVDLTIDWVQDEDNRIVGYMVDNDTMIAFPNTVTDENGRIVALENPDGTAVALSGAESEGGTGVDGADAYTALTASFTQPAVSAAVTVAVENTGFMVAGLPVYVEGGGFYLVGTVNSATSVDLTNLGYSPNAAQGTTVAGTGKVIPCGLRGLQGEPGADGAGGSGSSAVISAEATISLTTTATVNDASFVAFASLACTEIVVENDTGSTIEYSRGGSVFVPIAPGQIRRIVGLSNANEVSFRRVDYASGFSRPTVVSARAYTSTKTYSFAGTGETTITSGGGNTQLANIACTAIELMNNTGKLLTWRAGTTGSYRKLRALESVVINGLTNANEVYVKPYDFVADSLRPVVYEAFNSQLSEPFTVTAQARFIAPDSRILLDDGNYPSLLGNTGTFVSIAEQADQRGTLLPKNVTPLALFRSVATVTTNQVGACLDVSTGEPLFGSTSVEYTQPGASTVATFGPADVLPTGIDVTGSDIHIEYSFPDNAGVSFTGSNLSSFAVELYSAGTPASPNAAYHSVTIGASAQGFMKVDSRRGGTIVSFSIPIANFAAVSGGATLTAVTWARFRIQGGSGATGAKFRPHSIKAIKKARTKAAVVFVFDDLHFGQYTNALPILAKYNFPACCAVDTVVKIGQGNFLTPQQMVTLHQKHGWQMIGQTQGGNGLGPTSDLAIAAGHGITQAARFKLAMKALGISNTQDFSRGSTSFHNANGITGLYFDNWPAIKRVARCSVEFMGGNNSNPPFTIGETAPFGDPYAIRRVNMGGFTAGTLAQRWQEHTEQAIANKGVAIFGAHSEFNAAGEALTALGTFVEYLKTQELAGNLEVLTLAQVIDSAY